MMLLNSFPFHFKQKNLSGLTFNKAITETSTETKQKLYLQSRERFRGGNKMFKIIGTSPDKSLAINSFPRLLGLGYLFVNMKPS